MFYPKKKTTREKTTDVHTLNLSKKSILLARMKSYNEIMSFTNTRTQLQKKRKYTNSKYANITMAK